MERKPKQIGPVDTDTGEKIVQKDASASETPHFDEGLAKRAAAAAKDADAQTPPTTAPPSAPPTAPPGDEPPTEPTDDSIKALLGFVTPKRRATSDSVAHWEKELKPVRARLVEIQKEMKAAVDKYADVIAFANQVGDENCTLIVDWRVAGASQNKIENLKRSVEQLQRVDKGRMLMGAIRDIDTLSPFSLEPNNRPTWILEQARLCEYAVAGLKEAAETVKYHARLVFESLKKEPSMLLTTWEPKFPPQDTTPQVGFCAMCGKGPGSGTVCECA